jgi:four helix bundle protein
LCNIVEGSARRTEAEYLNFLAIANASAHELRYLLDLSSRVGYVAEPEFAAVAGKCELVTAGLGALLRSLTVGPGTRPKPEA